MLDVERGVKCVTYLFHNDVSKFHKILESFIKQLPEHRSFTED